jgi:hypothetical protein
MSPTAEQNRLNSTRIGPSRTNGSERERQTGWNPDDIDLDALAVKIVELWRRELRIELERKGRTR